VFRVLRDDGCLQFPIIPTHCYSFSSRQQLSDSISEELSISEYDAAEHRIVELRGHLDTTVMSQGAKRSMRADLEIIQKKNKAHRAVAKQAHASGIIAEAVREATEWYERTGQHHFVQVLDLGADAAAVKSAIEQLKKVHSDFSYLGISTEVSQGPTQAQGQLLQEKPEKLTIFAFVSDSAQRQGLRASEWVSAVAQACGGRGGGNSGLAQGSAMLPNTPDHKKAASDAAKKFLGNVLKKA